MIAKTKENKWKIAKGHESVKKLKVSNSRNTQTTELARAPRAVKGGTLLNFLTSIVAKQEDCCKNEGGPFWEFFWKKFQNAEKNGKGDPLEFFNILSVAKHQKMKKDLWGKISRKKSLTMPKKLKGGHLVSPGSVCYAEKQENLF